MKNVIYFFIISLAIISCQPEVDPDLKPGPAKKDNTTSNDYQHLYFLDENVQEFDLSGNQFFTSAQIAAFQLKGTKEKTNKVDGYQISFNGKNVNRTVLVDISDLSINNYAADGHLKFYIPESGASLELDLDGGVIIDKILSLTAGGPVVYPCINDIIFCLYNKFIVDQPLEICVPEIPICIKDSIADCFIPDC